MTITTPEQMREAAMDACKKVADEAKSYGIPQMTMGANTCYDAIRAIPIAPQPSENRLFDPDSHWGDFIRSAVAEAEKAMRKYPQPNYVITKVAEEAGEVVKAAVHAAEGRETLDNVRGEMLQLVAMLFRLWMEGDQVHGLPPVSGVMAVSANTTAPQPVAVTVKPLVPDGLIDALRHQRQIDMEGTEVAVSRQACDEAADILSALTIQPADPLSDPRVVALVEAAGKLRHSLCGPTGFADAVRHHSGQAYPWPSLDAAELALDAAIRADAIREAIEHAVAVIDAHDEYDQQLCCNGHMCGCQGATVHEVMKHHILALLDAPLSPTAVDGSPAPDAGGKEGV